MKRLSALAATVVLMAGACGDDSDAEDTTEDAAEDLADDEDGPADDEPTGGDPGEIPPAQGERIEVGDDGATRTIDCTDVSVLVEGEGNEITLAGECADVYVIGDSNSLSVEHADVLDIRGNANGTDVRKAENIQVVGDDNTLTTNRAETILVPGHRNGVSGKEVQTIITLGNETKATVEQAGTIVTMGNENDVTWSSGTFGSEPRVYDYGLSNLVKTDNL